MSGSTSMARRRADPVVWLAVVLFAAVVAMELVLASWLPRRLRSERLWGRETAMQELIEQVDWLRSHIRSLKFQDRWQRGEAELVLTCIDDIARYVREHQAGMTGEQVRLLHGDLARCERAYHLWKGRARHLAIEELDAAPWLERQRERLAKAVAEDSP